MSAERGPKVAILGSGVIGLSTAVELQSSGIQNVSVYSDRDLAHTTSVKAGAVFEPYRPGKMSDDTMRRYVREGLERYDEIIDSYPESDTGIRRHDLYSASTQEIDLDNYPFLSAIPEWDVVSNDERLGYYDSAVRLKNVPFIIPSVALLFLARQYESRGESRIQRIPSVIDLSDFVDTVDADVIINSTGLGAGALMKDAEVKPMRGQIAVMDYKPEWDHSVLGDDGYYVFPRSNGELILGGTTEEGIEEEKPELGTIFRIIENARRFLPNLQFAHLKRSYAGLRPFRVSGARVAEESGFHPSKRLISAYGHGGSGWTFNWGTARDIVRFIRGE